jgi:hypothetical protein
MRREIAVLLFFGLAAGAQNAPAARAVHLRGTVVEVGTNLPISGVEVKALTLESVGGLSLGANVGGKVTTHNQARTAVDGRFDLEVPGPGEYHVEASHADYGAPGPEMDAYESGIFVRVKDEATAPDDLRIELARPATFTGRVLDRETRKPLAGFSVAAMARSRRVSFDADGFPTQSKSAADGRFRIEKLPPAPYRIRIVPPLDARATIHAGTLDLAEEKPATGYCPLWWPGTAEREQAGIQPLGSGQERDLGDILAERCPTFSVAVRVTATGCAPGLMVGVAFDRLNGGARVTATLPCGQDSFIRGVVPGEYELGASALPGPANGWLWGLLRLTVTGQQRAELAFGPGLRMCGKVTGSEADMKRLAEAGARVFIRTAGSGSASKQAVPVDAEGNFCDDTVAPGLLRIGFKGLPEGMYLSATEYNGSPVGASWWPSPGALVHTLKLTVASGEASIAGTVIDGKKPQPDVRIFLTRWPMPAEEFRSQVRQTWSSATGGYALTRLVPGDYRMVAVAADTSAYWTLNGLLARFQAAKTLQIGIGENKALDVNTWVP